MCVSAKAMGKKFWEGEKNRVVEIGMCLRRLGHCGNNLTRRRHRGEYVKSSAVGWGS